MILLSAGGDKRMTFLTNSFLPLCRRVYQLAGDPGSPPANGVKKLDYLFWVQEQPDILLLPLPFSRDGVRLAQNAGKEEIKLNHLLDLCHRDTVVCGGMLDDAFLTECHRRNLTVFDYADDPLFYAENCRLTALGTEKVLAEEGVCLKNSRMLITGFGGCGKEIAKLLLQKGARVTVAARKLSAREEAASLGAAVLDFPLSANEASDFDIVINTVPALVVPTEFLLALPSKALFLELASLPGSEAEELFNLQFSYRKAPGLPGKYYPEEAARAIFHTICQFLSKGGHQFECN